MAISDSEDLLEGKKENTKHFTSINIYSNDMKLKVYGGNAAVPIKRFDL